MAEPRTYDVLIAGAGPAGLSTALFLLRDRPELAGRIAAIDKDRHPRPKVCAGGLISKTLTSLRELGLQIEVPHVEVFGGLARTSAGNLNLGMHANPLCTIVRRDQFDSSLARTASDRGLKLIESTKILRVTQDAECVRLETDRGSFQCKVLIGADGSGSRVRRDLFGGPRKEHIGRALMIDVPVDLCTTDEFTKRIYRFDFTCIAAHIGGYSWSFPCLIDGRAHLNLGIYEYRGRKLSGHDGTPSMINQLRQAFPAAQHIDNGDARGFKVFPIRWFDPGDSFVAGRTILVGDAAGVDPMMGEGISYAFDHGKMAAAVIGRFIAGDESALAQYDRVLHESPTGIKLRRLRFAANHFYGPRSRLYFRLAALSRTAQRIGVDWYNGANGVDCLSIPQVMAKWAGEVLLRRGPV